MKLNLIALSFIPGFMVGFEWAYDQGFFVFDLGIVRVTIDYWGVTVGDAKREEKSE